MSEAAGGDVPQPRVSGFGPLRRYTCVVMVDKEPHWSERQFTIGAPAPQLEECGERFRNPDDYGDHASREHPDA